MDRFAQGKVCAEEGCGQPSAGKFSNKLLCKDHLQAAMGRAKQQIPVADRGIQESEGTERIKYERFKQVMKTQIDEGMKDLSLADVNDKLHVLEKGAASSLDPVCSTCEGKRHVSTQCRYCDNGVCPFCNGTTEVRNCEDEECFLYYDASPDDTLVHPCHRCDESGDCEGCQGSASISKPCPDCGSKLAQVSADHEHHFESASVPGTFSCSCGLSAWYDRNNETYNVELHHDPKGCDIISGSSWDELNDNMRQRTAANALDGVMQEDAADDAAQGGVGTATQEAADADEEFFANEKAQKEQQANSLSCPNCGTVGVNQSHINGCKTQVQASGAHCYVCGGPVSKKNGVAINVDGRSTWRHKNPVVCNEYKDAYYAEPDSVLDSDDSMTIVSSNIVCAMCGDNWDTALLDHNKVAALVEGNACPTCDGAPLCMGCAHKFTAHKASSCGADEIRFDRRTASQVVAQCECDGYHPLDISYYDEHLESKFAAAGDRVVGWPAEAQPQTNEPFNPDSAAARPTGYPPRSDDDIELPGQDHPDDDAEGGNDEFPGKDILEGVAHGQDHLRQYRQVVTHDVPVKHIVDHLAELATGVEPATCKVCGQPMELHAQWAPTKQVESRLIDMIGQTFDHAAVAISDKMHPITEEDVDKMRQTMDLKKKKQEEDEKTTKVVAAYGREDVPATFIVDHLGELATGVEPATCKVCGEAMSRHSQWLPTKQASDSSDSFVPPASVANAAKRGLELRKKHNRGGTEVGVARARDLSNRKGLSMSTVKRMKAYFDRHEVDKKGEGWGKDSAGYIAWLLWGGDSGRSWANKIVKQHDKKEKKSSVDFRGWRNARKHAARPVDSCKKCGSTELNRPNQYTSSGMSLCRNCGAFNDHI